jgi:hypothetical protein
MAASIRLVRVIVVVEVVLVHLYGAYPDFCFGRRRRSPREDLYRDQPGALLNVPG